jgi:SNF2 family DNA or RNA helicase
MPPVLTHNGDKLELSLSGCRGFEFEDAKEKVKDIPGRRFDFESKLWIVEATPYNAERILKTIRPECDAEIINWIRESKSTAEESLTTPLPDDAELRIPWAKRRMPWQPEVVNDEKYDGLLAYQRAAVDTMADRGRAILADDMGLGKTFEAISAVEEWRLRNELPDGTLPDGPKLVVAPASVKGGWKRELERWLDSPNVVVVDAASPAKRTEQIKAGIEADAWIIVNWEQLRVKKVKVEVKRRNGSVSRKIERVMKEPLFEQTEWLAVIADEVHRAKNKDAQQTQGLWRIQAPVMYGLSGTPLMNSPDELWSILRWLWPHEYHDRGAGFSPGALPYWTFYNEYVDFWEDHFKRKVVTGVKNPDALRWALRDKLIRRTASLLGLKGRKRFYYDVPLTPKQQKLYDEAEKAMWLLVQKEAAAGDKDAIEFMRKAEAGASPAQLYRIPNGAARMVRLLQIIENCALLGGDDESAIMDDFEEKFADSRPYPWVYFFKYKDSCELMAERLRNKHGAEVGVYTGDTKPSDRTAMEDQFQRGELDAIVGTIDAMKEGITLTYGHLMAFGTRSFVPDINEQCEAREDRLGQQEQVRVYIPQAVNTVATSKVEPINRLKEGIVRTVLPKDTIKEGNL